MRKVRSSFTFVDSIIVASPYKNDLYGIGSQRGPRSACATVQSNQGVRFKSIYVSLIMLAASVDSDHCADAEADLICHKVVFIQKYFYQTRHSDVA